MGWVAGREPGLAAGGRISCGMILKPKPFRLASISKGFSTPVPRNSKDEVFPVVSAGGNTRFNTGGWSRRGALGGMGWF